MSAKPQILPIPQQIAAIVDDELDDARARILARVSELFGVAVDAQGPPRAAKVVALAPPPPSKRFRASPEAVAELQGKVFALFPRKGSEMKPRDVQRALGAIDRHRVSHALRALVEEGKLKLLGERGGARYVRAR